MRFIDIILINTLFHLLFNFNLDCICKEGSQFWFWMRFTHNIFIKPLFRFMPWIIPLIISWIFCILSPISPWFASSWYRLLLFLFLWRRKIWSLMSWTMIIEFLHLLLQVHKSWIFHYRKWLTSFNTLNWILLPMNISCYFLSLKCVSRIHIFTFVRGTHLLIELVFKFIELIWFLAFFCRSFLQVLILLLSMFHLSVVYFEHLLVKLCFVVSGWWLFLPENLNWLSLILPFLAIWIIWLSYWWVLSRRLIEALLFSLC